MKNCSEKCLDQSNRTDFQHKIKLRKQMYSQHVVLHNVMEHAVLINKIYKRVRERDRQRVKVELVNPSLLASVLTWLLNY